MPPPQVSLLDRWEGSSLPLSLQTGMMILHIAYPMPRRNEQTTKGRGTFRLNPALCFSAITCILHLLYQTTTQPVVGLPDGFSKIRTVYKTPKKGVSAIERNHRKPRKSFDHYIWYVVCSVQDLYQTKIQQDWNPIAMDSNSIGWHTKCNFQKAYHNKKGK